MTRSAYRQNGITVSVRIEEASERASAMEFILPEETALGGLDSAISRAVRQWAEETGKRPVKWAVYGLSRARVNML